jgi:hypothetical protein
VEGTPPSPQPQGDKSRHGCGGCAWACVAGLAFFFVIGVCLGPVTPSLKRARESAYMQTAHAIGQALYFYANDNHGLYPNGTSSTQVFQQLLDGGYVTDPSMFYVPMEGKTRPSKDQKLKPENVCWDVTGGASVYDNGSLPLIFLTGYRVSYAPGGGFTPLQSFPGYEGFSRGSGLAAFSLDNSGAWLNPSTASSGRSMEHFLPPDFNPHGKTFRQLTPDGVLR